MVSTMEKHSAHTYSFKSGSLTCIMKSRGILLCAALLFVGIATPARADEASKQAKIEELFDVMHIDQMLPQMIQQVMAQMQQMMVNQAKKMNLPPPEADPKSEEMHKRMVAMVTDRMNWQKLKPLYVKIYSDTFTEDEIGGISDFYKTPAGQAFLKKGTLLTLNTMQALQGIFSDIEAEIPKMLNDVNKQYDQKKPR
jgi:uncharacterized protein